MSKVAITKSKLDTLANTIAAKSGVAAPLTLDQMDAAVQSIPTGGGGTYQTKEHITPTESSQTITADTGYDALSSVQIDPISSSYVGSGVTRRSSTDLTASGDTVTVPAGYYAEQATKAVSAGIDVKTATGTFTGNGTRQMTISCAFEPDLIYFTSDPGTTASSGVVAAIIARSLMAAARYRNNSTTNSHYAVIDITAMNTGGSSYSFRATYANSTVTLYCFSNNARCLFTNGRTYSYTFIKYTA